VRTRDPSVQAQPMGLRGEGFDVARERIVGLVAMHIDPQALLSGVFAQHAHRLRTVGHGSLEMRNATHHVDAQRNRPLQVVEGARGAQDAVLRKRHELQVEIRCDTPLHFEQRFYRQQTRVAHVDVTADREQTACDRPVAILQSALDQCFLGQLWFEFAPQCDAFEQCAGCVDTRQAIRQCRVHVEMRIHERRRDKRAGGVDFFLSARREP